jgi:hypothetical protein
VPDFAFDNRDLPCVRATTTHPQFSPLANLH